MRCLYCHNPDTWSLQGGKEAEARAIIAEYKDKQDEIATLAEEEARPEGLINKLKAAF